MQSLLRIIEEFDTFKKVALATITGAVGLALFFGYRLVLSEEFVSQWIDSPRVLYVAHPCYLQHIRPKLFAVTVGFPVPSTVNNLRPIVTQNVAAFVVAEVPTPEQFRQLCEALRNDILDPSNEIWLKQPGQITQPTTPPSPIATPTPPPSPVFNR